MGTTEAATRAVVEQMGEAINRRDVDAVMACLTDDCVLENSAPAPDGERIAGAAALRRFFDAMLASPRVEVETEEIVMAEAPVDAPRTPRSPEEVPLASCLPTSRPRSLSRPDVLLTWASRASGSAVPRPRHRRVDVGIHRVPDDPVRRPHPPTLIACAPDQTRHRVLHHDELVTRRAGLGIGRQPDRDLVAARPGRHTRVRASFFPQERDVNLFVSAK